MSAGRKPIIVCLWRLQALQSKSSCAITSHYNRATRRCPSGLQAALCHTTSPRPPCPGLSSVHSHCLKPSASYSQCSNFHLLSPGSDVWHLHPQLSKWVFRHAFQHFSQNFCRGPRCWERGMAGSPGNTAPGLAPCPEGFLCATSCQLATACDFGGCRSHSLVTQTNVFWKSWILLVHLERLGDRRKDWVHGNYSWMALLLCLCHSATWKNCTWECSDRCLPLLLRKACLFELLFWFRFSLMLLY